MKAIIHTTTPPVTIGQVMVSADRKSTTAAPLADGEKIRRVVLPADIWGSIDVTLNQARSQSLCDILREQLRKLASEKLRDELAENPLQREVMLANYTVPELLKWSEETSSSRGSITFTREAAEGWFDSSATASAISAKHGAKAAPFLALVRNRFGALAAKNHGIGKSADAAKLISMVRDEDIAGAQASLVAELVGRLAHIQRSLETKERETTLSLDDISLD